MIPDENKEITQNSAENTDKDEPFSTIFSDPALNKKAEKTGKKSKLLLRAVCAAAAVAVFAAGVLAVIKLIPKMETDSQQEDNKISVIAVDKNAVSDVDIKNENGNIVLQSNLVEGNTESSYYWTVQGVNSDYTDSETVANTVNTVTTISASKEIATDSPDEYGMDNPTTTVTLTFRESAAESITLKIGNNASANLGCYCAVSDKPGKVYIIPTETVLALQCVATDFGKKTGLATAAQDSRFFSDNDITSFTKLELSGKNYQDGLEISMFSDETLNSVYAYQVTKPISRIAETEPVDNTVALFSSGITAAGIYAFDPTAEDIAKYGLDNPDAKVTLTLGEKAYSLSAAKVDDNYFAVVDGYAKVIYKVSSSALPFATNTTTDFYSKFIVLENLSKLSSFTMSVTGGQTYKIDISNTVDSESGEEVISASQNGVSLDAEKVKSMYRYLITASIIDYSSVQTQSTDMIIVLTHTDGSADTVVKFCKAGSQRYMVYVNNTEMGQITSTVYNQLIANMNFQ